MATRERSRFVTGLTCLVLFVRKKRRRYRRQSSNAEQRPLGNAVSLCSFVPARSQFNGPRHGNASPRCHILVCFHYRAVTIHRPSATLAASRALPASNRKKPISSRF